MKEQEALRSETVAAFHTAVDDEDEEDEDGLLVLREKTKDEMEREEEEYREFLRREVGEDISGLITVEREGEEKEVPETSDTTKEEDKDTKSKKKTKKNAGKGSKEDGDQEFLLKYVSQRAYPFI